MALALLRAGAIASDVDPHPVIWAMCRATATSIPFLLLLVGYRRWRGREGLGFGDIRAWFLVISSSPQSRGLAGSLS
jgi:leader peptidase (prepilin peptidase)/N-methyltransferase